MVRCRGAQPGARRARLFLRKHGLIYRANLFPADAFCAKRPCLRATTLLLRGEKNPKGTRVLKKEARGKEIFFLFCLPPARIKKTVVF
ncbi:MAG: hypothetical protein AMJ94_02935 [Deltaproteobacteria bacterium SM23_61]|nr:MAG: hypothetical protein AMJ94_02935 [Deltaproteobacteria bacterium SM23_61]